MKNKVAILSITDIRHIAMIRNYTDYFDAKGMPYEIICAERYGDKEIKFGSAKLHLFPVAGHQANKIKKLLDFIRFRQFAIRVLKENQYKYVIVWNERTMALFAGFLRRYSKYCVNIRDIGFPRIPLFWNQLNYSVQHSDFATWCAQRGTEYLPKHDYVIILNQNKDLVVGARKEQGFVEKGRVINIGVVGYIRHIEPSKELMRAFCNDERFVLHFYGNGAETLEGYAKEIGMNNIKISGAFRPEETSALLDKIDVLNVYVGDGRVEVDQALGSPIRYGYSTLLYKPAIVSPNTFLSDKTKGLNIAYTVQDFESLADDFYHWYHSLSFDEFKAGCEKYNKEFDDSIKNLHRICDKKIYPVVMGEEHE